jgi:hypothetical protein
VNELSVFNRFYFVSKGYAFFFELLNLFILISLFDWLIIKLLNVKPSPNDVASANEISSVFTILLKLLVSVSG